MKPVLYASLTALALLAAAPSAHAANARNPYGNVDRRNDAGNDTGNSQVDRLNDMQLNRNYTGPTYPAAPGGPPPAYAPPPPAYAAPRPQPFVPPGYYAPQPYGTAPRAY